MEGRPVSAPPQDFPTPIELKTRDLERRAKSSIDGSSPDSIEVAATLLFHRVRALVSADNESEDGDESARIRESQRLGENIRSKSPAGATSSYYADEGESGDSESLGSDVSRRVGTDGQRGKIFDGDKRPDTGYESSDPDLDTVIRIGDVVHKSIASSIVKESGSTLGRAHFSHASIPTDIGRTVFKQKSRNRSLGRMTPSPAASAVGTIGALAEGSAPEADDDKEEGKGRDQVRAGPGGASPEKRRDKFMPSPPPLLDTTGARRTRGVYDESSSPESGQDCPDLFAKPLRVGTPVRRAPDTPPNTIASPQPLIGIIPATDSSNACSPISIDTMGNVKVNGQSAAAGVHTPPGQSMVGHTGATTPEDDSEYVPGTATVNRGTMTEFDYDEYAEEEYGPPGVSTSETPRKKPSKMGLEEESEGNPQGLSKYSTDAFANLSSYDDSDPPPAANRKGQSSLYQAYMQSEMPKGSQAADSNNPKEPGEPQNISRGQMRLEEGSGGAPATTQSFTRIITDLEAMLNHALEIAGRAVKDSSSALDQRDASIRSLQSSTRGSLVSSGFEGTERAVTAPESVADPEEYEEVRENVREVVSQANEPNTSEPSQQSKKIHGDANPSSSTAVYSDSGEPTSQSNLDYNKVVRKKNRRRSPLPVIDLAESERERAWHALQDDSVEQVSTVDRRDFNPGNLHELTPGPEQRYRMEVGRDGEIILVRITQPKPPPPQAGGISLPTDGETNPPPPPHRYKGGWEWSLGGKRFTAAVACGVVGLIGWIVGSYYAELRQIEEHLEISPRVASLGNSMFFLGLAIPTIFLWPLPLLHGRKPYLLLSVSLLLPLQLPQALSLPPYTTDSEVWERSMQPYAACLLFFRSISGLIMGLAFMNAFATILDLFGPDTGACCRGGVVFNNIIPLEGQNQYHGVPGGESGVRAGVWIGIFTWMFVASPGLGYLFGKIAIEAASPAWGFWTVAILASFLLMLVLIAPEVRPAWKSIEMCRGEASRRGNAPAIVGISGSEIAERGEIRRVMFGSSPRWWWEEVWAACQLSWKMMQQYGFLLLALYFGWVFGHLTLVMMLLASLIDLEYKFASTDIGLAVLALPLGALLVIPTQFSMFYLTNFRHRSSVILHNRKYGHTDVGQHPYRRTLQAGMAILPMSSILLTISASGTTHFMVPVFFAAVVSLSGALVVAESYVLLMDNFDISDLPEPSMESASVSMSRGRASRQQTTGLHQLEDEESFKTSHPCLSSSLAICHGLAFLFAAMAVGVSSHMIDGIGIRKGLGVYTAGTCVVTFGLAYTLWRSKEVRLVEVFNDHEQQARNAKVSLLQRSWGTRWTEVNGMEWWGDEHAV